MYLLFYFLFDCCLVWFFDVGEGEGEREMEHKVGQVVRIWEEVEKGKRL